MKRSIAIAVLFACVLGYSSVVARPPVPKTEKDDDEPGPNGRPSLTTKKWVAVDGHKGLKSWDVKPGSGDAVKADATVTIHYTGWLKDGKVFDSSVKRNEKATFPLNALIKGWQAGIPGMKPGGVRRLYIPWEMAYGERGAGDLIPPKADLIFEIELLEAK